MYTVLVCLREPRTVVVARYQYESLQAALLGRVGALQHWVRDRGLRALVSHPRRLA